MNNIKHKIVTDMCYTTRHDYGLNKSDICSMSSGMTDQERQALYNNMSQLYEHHIHPLVAALVDVEVLLKANTSLYAQLNEAVIERARNALPTL